MQKKVEFCIEDAQVNALPALQLQSNRQDPGMEAFEWDGERTSQAIL